MDSLDSSQSRSLNKTRIYIGLLKEPDIVFPAMDDDNNDDNAEAAGEGGEKPRKKKSKKDSFLSKRSRNDPNAPPPNRIPLPELRDSEKMDKLQAMRESAKRLKLSSETLPSICFYTLLNASVPNNIAVHCTEISEDSALLAAGLSDSTIKVWSLTPNKLKAMKSAAELELIDREVEDVLTRMMDDKSTTDLKVLHGHSGPIYGLSFSPDRSLLLSASEDATSKNEVWSTDNMMSNVFASFQFDYGACKLGPTFAATKATVFQCGTWRSVHMDTTLHLVVMIKQLVSGPQIIINL